MFAPTDDLAWRPGDVFLGRTKDGADAGLACERGAICIAGSRAGKGSALIIPNLMRWPHAALVIDPKGENANATWEARERFGPVYVLDPFSVASVPDRLRATCNPLDAITADSTTAREDIRVIADGLVMRTNDKDAVWDDGAVTVIAGLIAHAIASGAASLPAMRELLKGTPEALAETFVRMAETGEAFGGLARTAATIGLDDTRSAAEFVAGAARHTDWLESPAMAALLGASSFSLAELKRAPATVFLCLPPAYLAEHGRFLRMFVLAALSEMTRHGLSSGQCLFVLDEFFALGRLDMLQKAAGLLPGYGVRLFPFLQDLGQLTALYRKDGAETFLANADAQIFFGNSDLVTLSYVSNRIGTFTDDELGAEPPQLKDYRRRSRKIWESLDDLKSRIDIENRMIENWYKHKMARIGRPRQPPDALQKLTGKPPGEPVAASMVVFGPLGRVYNLKLAPYFLPAPQKLVRQPAHRSWAREAIAAAVVILILAAGVASAIAPRSVALSVRSGKPGIARSVYSAPHQAARRRTNCFYAATDGYWLCP